MEGRAGAGVYCLEMELEQSHSLGRYCTVFQAEIYAIMCGTQADLQQKLCGKIRYQSLELGLFSVETSDRLS